MTTKIFSATNLPRPRYSLEVGRFTLEPEDSHQRYQHPNKRLKLDINNKAKSTHSRAGEDDDDHHQENHYDDDDDAHTNFNLPSTCLPRFSQLAQVVEVKKPGLTLPNRVSPNIKDFLGSYCVIENALPELFIRRDFISKFVDKGTIFVAQLSDHHGAAATTTTNYTPTPSNAAAPSTATLATTTTTTNCGYSLSTTKDNVLIITMNSKQYHRFGLLATKVISPLQPSSRRRAKRGSTKRAREQLYRIEIDLKDERIMRSNKYQDKLMQKLRRLNSINKIYFRFIPDKSKLDLSLAAAQELSLEYFNYVIDEYNLDGCKPVPLTGCSIAQQKMIRNWVNYSQLHPSIELSKLIAGNGGEMVLFQSELDRGRNDEKFGQILGGIVEVIDWLGFQLLRLDCDNLAEIYNWNESYSSPAARQQRYDVSCSLLIGPIDSEHVQGNLDKLFVVDEGDDDSDEGDSGVMFRALFLYDFEDDKQLLTSHDSDRGLAGESHGPSSCSAETKASGRVRRKPTPFVALADGEDRGSKNRAGHNRCVAYLQDCSNGPKAAREITVIGLTDLEK